MRAPNWSEITAEWKERRGGGEGGFLSAGLDGAINTVESERRLQKANTSEAIFTPYGAIFTERHLLHVHERGRGQKPLEI